jgi:serine/threonine protein kinase
MTEPGSADQYNATMLPDPRIGSTLADRYRIIAPLGEGGMGTVYRGVHEALRRPVAIKFLQQKIHGNREMVARFEREAVTAANLRHPNIADAIDYGSLSDGTLYLVMELVEGVPLRKLIVPGHGLSVERVVRVMEQMASALDLAHSMGIVHRDLKPENIIIFDRGSDRDVIKIIDFGIARINSATFETSPQALTQAGAIFGTPQYMAPEQVMGQVVDGRADQYAVGIIAFEMLTGTQPFTGDTFAELVMKHVGAPAPLSSERAGHVTPAMDAAISRMMSKLPDERFGSVTEAFRAMTGAEPIAPQSLPASSLPKTPGTLIMHTTNINASLPPNTQGVAFAATILPGEQPLLTQTLPSAGQQQNKNQKFLVVIAGVVGLAVLLSILGIAKCVSGPNPAIREALAQWEDHKYAAAATALRDALKADPNAADDESLAKALAASVQDPLAWREIDSLLETTALGKSPVIAEKIADTATTDEKHIRDPALDLLRGRHDLLNKEKRARVSLRDAETCNALLSALAALDAEKTSSTEADADRYRRGECRKMIRRDHLCNMCLGRASPSSGGEIDGPAPPPKGKGKGKKWK